ncbi:MAG: hypothetical protein RLZZ01_1147 [Actinomycetota bacterium]
MRRPPHIAIIVALLLVVLAGCSSTSTGTGSDATTHVATPVAELVRPYDTARETRTYVDDSRATRANGSAPALPTRTLVTTIVHPTSDAGAPFPLVVFAHGFGGNEDLLIPLATSWARAGFFVAIPRFPLTTTSAPGGVNGSDIVEQPADVGFVIDSVIAESEDANSPLHDLVDPDSLALAGHSNGAITTLGTIANSCCRDRRIDAAIVFAGTTSPFGGGTYDLRDIPPVLFVHGTDDALIDFDMGARAFNDAASPKGMLRIENGSHVSILVPTAPEFVAVERTTTDFLDATLRADAAALTGLPDDGLDGVATMFWSGDDASGVTVPTIARSTARRTATITAQDGLRAGQTVTVTWNGFIPGRTVNIVQCTGDGRGGSETCEIVPGRVLIPDPTGEGSLDITITVGAVGNGVCDADHPCTILVNDAGLQEPEAFVYFPITFAR